MIEARLDLYTTLQVHTIHTNARKRAKCEYVVDDQQLVNFVIRDIFSLRVRILFQLVNTVLRDFYFS